MVFLSEATDLRESGRIAVSNVKDFRFIRVMTFWMVWRSFLFKNFNFALYVRESGLSKAHRVWCIATKYFSNKPRHQPNQYKHRFSVGTDWLLFRTAMGFIVLETISYGCEVFFLVRLRDPIFWMRFWHLSRHSPKQHMAGRRMGTLFAHLAPTPNAYIFLCISLGGVLLGLMFHRANESNSANS